MVQEEYERLMADTNAATGIAANLLELAPKVLMVAENRKLPSNEVKSLLDCLIPSEDDTELNAEDKTFVAFCLLPYLLEKKTKGNPNPESFLYQVGDDEEEVAAASKEGMPPFIIFKGTISEPDITSDIFIAAEGKILMKVAGGILEAIKCLLFSYYVCNLQYPKNCFSVYFFLQRQVLQVFDKQKVPTRMMMLMAELSKLS